MKPADLESRLRLLASLVEHRKKTELAPSGGLLSFTKWFFPIREGMEFLEGPHHRLMCQTLDRVLRGEISRLIITLPPGYTKTEIAVVNLIAKGFQINPGARFIHATFSDDLARENSDKAKALIELPEYQDLQRVTIRTDSRAKDRWKTDQGGGMLAKAAGGPITGFRAGYMDKDRFTGALLVDDPLKPDDAFSPAKRQAVIRKAQDLDQRWDELTKRVTNFGKTLAVTLADIPWDLVETRLDELFSDEKIGRSILGDAAYEALQKLRSLTDEQVESVEILKARYDALRDAAQAMAVELAGAASTADQMGNDALWEALATASNDMRSLSAEFANGSITGEEFASRMEDIRKKAADALAELQGIDRQGFDGIIASLGGLGNKLLDLIGKAKELKSTLPGSEAANVTTGTGLTVDQIDLPGTSNAPETSVRPKAAPAMISENVADGSSGKKGSGSTKGDTRLESLVNELKTEKEITEEWYQESLDLLNSATEQQLAALGGKHEAIERLEQEHRDRLQAIQDASQQYSLESVLGAGANIIGALGATNAKALKIAQAFAAAEALVSTYKGAAKELEKGTFGFASAAAVIARGAMFIAAIKGASASSSSTKATATSSTTSTATEAASTPIQAVLNPIDPKAMYSGQSLIDLFSAIQKEAKSRGIVWTTT